MLFWIIGAILFMLSGIHLYWMAGGEAGAKAVIPSNGSEPLFRPGKAGTGMVAAALALAGWFVLELSGAVERYVFPEWLFSFGGWVLGGIFLLRAIGDLKWVGFFKKQRRTLFATWDTMFYSPLCLFLGAGAIAAQIM
jgi:hypothetical protein